MVLQNRPVFVPISACVHGCCVCTYQQEMLPTIKGSKEIPVYIVRLTYFKNKNT